MVSFFLPYGNDSTFESYAFIFSYVFVLFLCVVVSLCCLIESFPNDRFTTQLQVQALLILMVHGGMIGRKDDRVYGAAVSSFIAQTFMFFLMCYF
jgi:hypothetical protein